VEEETDKMRDIGDKIINFTSMTPQEKFKELQTRPLLKRMKGCADSNGFDMAVL
jgi:hypothetical protein